MLITYLIDLFYQRSTEWEGPFSKRWKNKYWKTCETFKELNLKGKLPVDEAMRECTQICENESGCNALIFRNVSVSCTLRKCPTPVPIPDITNTMNKNVGTKFAYFLPGKHFELRTHCIL